MEQDNLINVLQTAYQWRKALRNMCLLALVLSAGLSLLLKDYYKATTICYPASPDLANPELTFATSGTPTRYYGDDRDLDRVAQIANSEEVADFLIRKFNLYSAYGQDSTTYKGRAKTHDIFRSLYSAQKNANDALEISMEDVDRQKAADITNAARDKVDEISKRLIHDSQQMLLHSIEQNLTQKQVYLNNLTDSLQYLQNKYGVYGTELQGEVMATQLAMAEGALTRNRARLSVLEGNPDIPRDTIAYLRANLRAAEQWRDQLTKGSNNSLSAERFTAGLAQVMLVRDLHIQGRKQMSYDMERYRQIKAMHSSDIKALHVVEYAEVPDFKSRPKRSIIVIVSVLAAFLFTLIAALIADAYKQVEWKKIMH